jgi:hypothetical protein
MSALRISRLQRRYGMSQTQARLIAELFFGGSRNV